MKNATGHAQQSLRDREGRGLGTGAAVFDCRAQILPNGRVAAFNQISRKHVDFVLRDPRTLVVLAVIELDDRSHHWPDRQARDVFVNEALTAARISVVHVPCRQADSVLELRRILISVLPPGNSPPYGRRLEWDQVRSRNAASLTASF